MFQHEYSKKSKFTIMSNISYRPDPNAVFPDPKIPSLCYIKNVVKNPRIIIGDWAELNNAPILPKHINCEGCRMNGAKTVFCSSLCEIRKCAVAKRFKTCGECHEKDTCPKVGIIWQNNPQAKENLKA